MNDCNKYSDFGLSNIHTITYWFYAMYDIMMLHASSLLFISRTEYFLIIHASSCIHWLLSIDPDFVYEWYS